MISVVYQPGIQRFTFFQPDSCCCQAIQASDWKTTDGTGWDFQISIDILLSGAYYQWGWLYSQMIGSSGLYSSESVQFPYCSGSPHPSLSGQLGTVSVLSIFLQSLARQLLSSSYSSSYYESKIPRLSSSELPISLQLSRGSSEHQSNYLSLSQRQNSLLTLLALGFSILGETQVAGWGRFLLEMFRGCFRNTSPLGASSPINTQAMLSGLVQGHFSSFLLKSISQPVGILVLLKMVAHRDVTSSLFLLLNFTWNSRTCLWQSVSILFIVLGWKITLLIEPKVNLLQLSTSLNFYMQKIGAQNPLLAMLTSITFHFSRWITLQLKLLSFTLVLYYLNSGNRSLQWQQGEQGRGYVQVVSVLSNVSWVQFMTFQHPLQTLQNLVRRVLQGVALDSRSDVPWMQSTIMHIFPSETQ